MHEIDKGELDSEKSETDHRWSLMISALLWGLNAEQPMTTLFLRVSQSFLCLSKKDHFYVSAKRTRLKSETD